MADSPPRPAGAVGSAADPDGADRYGSILDQLREGFQVLDPQWRYLYVNDAVETQSRRPRRQLLGRSMLEQFPGIEQTPLFAVLQRCMRERTSAEFQNRFVHADGQVGWFELRIRPVPEGLVVLSVDVTERRRLEERLQQSQRLDAAGRMAAGLAHDFGNLLAAIDGSVNLALGRDPSAAVRGDLELALGATARARALVEQLMAFSRQRPVVPCLMRLAARVQAFAELLARAVGSRHPLNLELELAPAVRIDPGAFEQVLLNLVVNAAEAMPDGGPITVRTGDVVFEKRTHFGALALAPGRYASLTVVDRGVGLAPEAAARIFEPFFTTKAQSNGTGLGLSTCFGIVRQAGGAIAVCSEPGQGATFAVYLPAARPDEGS